VELAQLKFFSYISLTVYLKSSLHKNLHFSLIQSIQSIEIDDFVKYHQSLQAQIWLDHLLMLYFNILSKKKALL